MNMFYHRVEMLINEEDQDYNYLSHKFGYKCCFIRDLSEPSYVYESYIPILISKGQAKLRRIKKAKAPLAKPSFAEDNQPKKVSTACTNILNHIQNQEFDTDESMKGIELEDIKSEMSEDVLVPDDDIDGNPFQGEKKEPHDKSIKAFK
mmetsp:Transcript_33448/g.51361  ORF Transcript_33448/g.51361 Transcript_33448/m.51361 type:complete len:149 (+) Transcript_33448:5862-6308(+)